MKNINAINNLFSICTYFFMHSQRWQHGIVDQMITAWQAAFTVHKSDDVLVKLFDSLHDQLHRFNDRYQSWGKISIYYHGINDSIVILFKGIEERGAFEGLIDSMKLNTEGCLLGYDIMSTDNGFRVELDVAMNDDVMNEFLNFFEIYNMGGFELDPMSTVEHSCWNF